MKLISPAIFLVVLSLSIPNSWSAAPEKSVGGPKEIPTIAPTPIASPVTLRPIPTPAKVTRYSETSKALVIHKPMPSSSWGKVIQYRREQIFAFSEENREILHEFVFQTDEGIIRTAVFHETASGNGYWEVSVWDQQ